MLALILALQAVDFTRDVRPILAEHCFKCHGPDEEARKAKLRLDRREPAVAAASELLRRIGAEGTDDLMPPPSANKPLTDAKRAVLRRWIAEGAPYAPHWAFVPPRAAPPPAVRRADWCRTPVDRFTLARLEAAGLAPAPEADRATLARRVALDLTGLPPTLEEADAFLKDPAADAYERYVDRLLASPRYGERWARAWLDLARYADTNGYEKDRVRSIWPWRDWVIRALNDDMPYDRFTLEQIAGDMLPGDSRVATGFHRNTMLNEEGGIDPLEFRFHAMVDRVNTTATVWLGLTFGCAQCHTHKFDPIPHADYYRLMDFLNNADEITIPVPGPRRADLEARIAVLEASLEERFPPGGELAWRPVAELRVATASGSAVEMLPDGSVRLAGTPDTDVTTVTFRSDAPASALKLELLTDDALPRKGPGRAPNGNFVLGELAISVEGRPLAATAEADHAQDGFPAANVFNGNPKSGWAGDGPKGPNHNRTLTVTFDEVAAGAWALKLDQPYGGAHTIGRFRIQVGAAAQAVSRRENLARHFDEWLTAESARAVAWTILRPSEAKSAIPTLTVLDDASILASGDKTKRDVYEVTLPQPLPSVRALRLEVLPDDRLPRGGPGRVDYEGPFGDFFLSEILVEADGQPVKMAGATQSFAAGGNTAAKTIDGDPQTGWTIDGTQGQTNAAVLRLAEPTSARTLRVTMVCERYYAAGVGRFRLSVTDDARPVAAHGVPAEVERMLLKPAEHREALRRHYLSVAAPLAPVRNEIKALRAQIAASPTTLVMSERLPGHRRPTHVHRRGEFLQPTDPVTAELPSIFPPMAAGAPRDRAALARWLVSADNPMVGRVTMNRHWAALFGTGLVRTLEDFGTRGEAPSHPELLDWLALEFARQGWSFKKMHRLLVTSAVYRQASGKGPGGAPRVRLEAEMLRDAALRASGLLSEKIGGPSVFPPQPAGISSEGAYGPLKWEVSQGEDRYRRGLYTFAKRTAPYAMLATFDAPSGECCVARRERSNTPLQALTLLNDEVFVEAARALGQSVAGVADPDEACSLLFRRVLTRPPDPEELAELTAFFARRRSWEAVARVVLNLDEAVTKP